MLMKVVNNSNRAKALKGFGGLKVLVPSKSSGIYDLHHSMINFSDRELLISHAPEVAVLESALDKIETIAAVDANTNKAIKEAAPSLSATAPAGPAKAPAVAQKEQVPLANDKKPSSAKTDKPAAGPADWQKGLEAPK